MTPQDSNDFSLGTYVKRLWIHGFLAGFAVLLVILLLWFFIWGWPWGTTSEGPEEAKPTVSQAPAPATPPAPAAKAAPPAAAKAKPAVTLKEELEPVLARLAEANQKKDLPQLLSVYDPAFPDLQHKTEEISRTWATYDYRSLRFRIEELKSQSPESASARVVWEAETRNITTHEIKDLTRTYLVGFVKDAGQWRIRSLEKAGAPGEQEKTG